jgi:4-hydroxy-tetrahydrodipicolinate synthase
MSDNIFTGCIPALMTPCTAERKPDFDALVAKGRELIAAGMSAVVYCGSMGDWPLLTEAERQEGVARLVAAGVPTIVGTGAVNTREAVPMPPMPPGRRAWPDGDSARAVAWRVADRAKGPLFRHPRRCARPAAVIYNSPYYGFATRADLFFELRRSIPT